MAGGRLRPPAPRVVAVGHPVCHRPGQAEHRRPTRQRPYEPSGPQAVAGRAAARSPAGGSMADRMADGVRGGSTSPRCPTSAGAGPCARLASAASARVDAGALGRGTDEVTGLARTVQIRTYTVRAGLLDEWVDRWQRLVVPLRRDLGFEIHGSWKDRARNQHVWVISHEGPESFDEANAAYWASERRRRWAWTRTTTWWARRPARSSRRYESGVAG